MRLTLTAGRLILFSFEILEVEDDDVEDDEVDEIPERDDAWLGSSTTLADTFIPTDPYPMPDDRSTRRQPRRRQSFGPGGARC